MHSMVLDMKQMQTVIKLKAVLNKTLKDLVGIDFTAVPTGDKLGTVSSKENIY